MKCTTCKSETVGIITRIINGSLVDGCDSCLGGAVKEAAGAARYNRERQKVDYRREITQPNQREFARAYPKKFREIHGDDLYRKLA